VVKQQCRVAGYPQEIWFSSKGLATILSFKHVLTAGLTISYDCIVPRFTIHREHIGLKNLHFVMHSCGLHYYRPPDNGVVLLNTVSLNTQGFTKQKVKATKVAIALQSKLGHPSKADMHWIIKQNMVKGCPVMILDVDNALTVHGPSIPALKGKTAKKKPAVVNRDLVKAPREFMKLVKDVTLCVDIFFVNKVPFIITLSLKIYFTTVTHLDNRKITPFLRPSS
jgi:hypothetical protein